MPIVNKWVCGCLLPVGGVVLGWTEIIINAIVIIFVGTCISFSDMVLEALKEAVQKGEIELDDDEKQEDIEMGFKFFSTIFTIYLIYRLILLASAVMLLIGSTNKKRSFLIPYLITEPFNILWLGFILIVTAISGFNVTLPFLICVLIGWSVYAWLCVLSLHQECRINENRPADPILLQSTSVNPNVYTANPTTYPINANVYSVAPPSYSSSGNYPRQQPVVNQPLLTEKSPRP